VTAGYVWRDPARHRRPPQHTTEAAVTQAITNPDTVTPRRQYETQASWQARAVLDVISQAIRQGREPFAGLWDDAVAAGREHERAMMLARLRQRADAGDDLARLVTDIVKEIT
jgi:hypothetical protein